MVSRAWCMTGPASPRGRGSRNGNSRGGKRAYVAQGVIGRLITRDWHWRWMDESTGIHAGDCTHTRVGLHLARAQSPAGCFSTAILRVLTRGAGTLLECKVKEEDPAIARNEGHHSRWPSRWSSICLHAHRPSTAYVVVELGLVWGRYWERAKPRVDWLRRTDCERRNGGQGWSTKCSRNDPMTKLQRAAIRVQHNLIQ